jgi:hypothetical protein
MSIFIGSDGRGCEGGVLRVNAGCAAGTIATIAVDPFPLQLPITGYSLDMGTNHQFLHSLDNFIYLYAFGDRIGELTLSGLAFTGSCVQNNGGGDISNAMSQCAILSYYNDSRVSNSNGTKASLISIGNCSKILRGFLTGMRLDVPDPSAPVVQWALRYHVILLENKIPSVTSITRIPAATGPTGSPSNPHAAAPAPSGGGTARDGTYRPGGGRAPIATSRPFSIPWPKLEWPTFPPGGYPPPPKYDPRAPGYDL